MDHFQTRSKAYHFKQTLEQSQEKTAQTAIEKKQLNISYFNVLN